MKSILLITVVLLITNTIIGQNDKDEINKQFISHSYFRNTGTRHPNPEKLIIKKTKKFTIRESNFKGIWITKGDWEVKGDTLILHKSKRISYAL